MTQERYFDDAESRDWILETHAKQLSNSDKRLIRQCCSAFTIEGNEDCPERICFYGTNSPLYSESPIISLKLDDGGQYARVD